MVEARGDGLLGTGRFGPAYWQDHAAGARCGDRRRPRGSPAVPRLWRRRCRHRAGRHAAARRRRASLARHGRDPDVPDRRPRQPPRRRVVRRPVRAAARPRLRRDVRRDRQRDARLAAAPGDRRAGVRRRHRADDLQRRPARRVARRRRASSTSTRCSGGPSEPRTDRGAASAQPWYACACCPPNLMRIAQLAGRSTSRRPTRAAIQVHQFATAEIQRPGRRRHRPARRWRRAIRGTAACASP